MAKGRASKPKVKQLKNRKTDGFGARKALCNEVVHFYRAALNERPEREARWGSKSASASGRNPDSRNPHAFPRVACSLECAFYFVETEFIRSPGLSLPQRAAPAPQPPTAEEVGNAGQALVACLPHHRAGVSGTCASRQRSPACRAGQTGGRWLKQYGLLSAQTCRGGFAGSQCRSTDMSYKSASPAKTVESGGCCGTGLEYPGSCGAATLKNARHSGVMPLALSYRVRGSPQLKRLPKSDASRVSKKACMLESKKIQLFAVTSNCEDA